MKSRMPRSAGPLAPASSARSRAVANGTPWLAAQASMRATVVSPMPRLGVLSTRLTDTSSAGLTVAFR